MFNASLPNTKGSFFFSSLEIKKLDVSLRNEGNFVCGLSCTGVLRWPAIFKISLLCPSGIPASSFSFRYFALAVDVKPLLRNSPVFINKSTSLRKSWILHFSAIHISD